MRLFHRARSRLTVSLLTGVLAFGTAGCDVPEDENGTGSVPSVSGVIEGTVLYAGPRPFCDYAGDTPTAVRGNVVLLMFLSNNPPPPTGTATSASNLLLVPARDVFALGDCLPAAPTLDDFRVPVTRSAGYIWPEIALANGEGETVDYQVRGFFDTDADFNPFFSVRRLTTRADVAGGAFVNTAAVPPQFERITFASAQDRPNGQVVPGVAVTLGARVNTELPAFELGAGTRALNSETTVPATSDALMREQQLWDGAMMSLTLIDPVEASWANTLTAGGMVIDPSPAGFAWFTLPVDADRNGEQDLHPVLGESAGILWEHPIVILRRARNIIEQRVGIPDVVIVATVRPSQTLSRDTFGRNIDIAVPPIAVVNLNPLNPACNIPYIAPSNIAELYERIPVDCQEVPTGNYDINVLSGIAGGQAVNYRRQLSEDMPTLPRVVLDALVAARTDNDWVIEGGSFSSQAWSIPNELGCPDPTYRPNALDADGNPIAVSQVDADPLANCGAITEPCDSSGTNMQCSQGPAGRFSVVDADGTNAPDHTNTTAGHGIPTCQTTIRATTMMPDAVTYMPIPDGCCDGVAHLCGIPLCDLTGAAVLSGEGGERAIRDMGLTDVSADAEGNLSPTCIPFLMPAACCGG